MSVGNRTKWLASIGVAAAWLLTLNLNVIAGRHYRRWDATRARLYTLSDATTFTLDSLEQSGQDVEIFVFIGAGEPLLASIKALLQTYQARARRHLIVRYLDPDRNPIEFARLKVELDVHVEKAEGGRILADAQIVVRHGKRVWYVKTDDMIVLDEGDDAKVRPRAEGALTGAIRAVLSTERTRVCFTTGHHEAAIDDPGKEGLAMLKNTLAKDNYEPESIDPTKSGASLLGCKLIAIVSPTDAFKLEETKPILEAVQKGTSLLLVIPPQLDPTTKGLRAHGLAEVAALGGVTLDDAVAVEEDGALREPGGFGLIFKARTHPHATTDDIRKLAESRGIDPAFLVFYARPMARITGQAGTPQELVVSSGKSFGMHDVEGFFASKSEPQRAKGDREGPLDLAVALQRDGSVGGAKVVVIGFNTPFINLAYIDLSPPVMLDRALGQVWLSWLTARPPVLDIAPKSSVQVAMHLSEEDLAAIARYVLVFMPASVLLLGTAVWLRRRSTEGKRVRGGGA